MKFLTFFALCSLTVSAQQHFSGMSTSSHGGILNGGINPAEFANTDKKFTVSVFAFSTVASSNKVGLDDFLSGEDIGRTLFTGDESTSFKFETEFIGPGVAIRLEKFTLALTSRAHARLDVLDIDTRIGDAIFNDNVLGLVQTTAVTKSGNQRVNGTTWGEIGISGARTFLNNEKHAFSAGATLKLLFPGSYANIGFSKFTGDITTADELAILTNTEASVNIAYSGNLGDSFTETSDYFSSLFGALNGVAADIGVNYRWKETDDKPGYKLNAGMSLKNIGRMAFKANNNASTNYTLSVQGADELDLADFENVSGLRDIEQVFLQSGYLTRENGITDFRVALPTLFVAYADFKVYSKFYLTTYAQFKVQKDRENDQIANENVFSITPRVSFSNIEAYVPVSFNEVSGINAGAGFRAYGFFLGSSSVLTAFSKNSKQADVFLGYGFRL